MKPKKPTLDERILAALNGRSMDSYSLANILWPQDTHGSAWRYQSNGGPPGWVLPLGKAIKRMRLQTWTGRDGKRIIGQPEKRREL